MDEEDIVEETTAAEEEAAAEPSPDAEEAPAARRRRPLWRSVARWSWWSLVVVAIGTLLFFTQTHRGQGIVLDEVLGRVRGSLAGELEIDGIRSRSLLLGLTLQGVRLTAGGDRPFLEADSVVIRYSPLSLAIGSPRLRSSVFYGLHVEISRYPGDDFANVNRLLAEGDGEASASASTFGLGRIGIRQGTVEILMPTEGAPEELTVPGPDGGRLRRMAFENLDLDLERTVVRTVGPVVLDTHLASLSTSVHILGEPLVIREAQGDLTFGDRGLRLEGGDFRLPGSFLVGGVRYGPERPGEDWTLAAEFRSDDWSDLADLHWVDARIPSGRFRGGAALHLTDGIDIDLDGVEVQTGGSAVALDGGVRFADAMSMTSLRVTATPMDLSLLDPWLEEPLPLKGRLRGNATLGGTLSDLSAMGRMTFTPDSLPGAATTADVSGVIHAGDNPGGSSLQIRLDPFDYRVLTPLWADAARLGTGRATLSVEGRANDGMLVVADVTHRSSSTTTSRAVARGTIRRNVAREWVVDIRGELSPLSLPLLGRLWPQIDLPGEVRGPVRVDGRVSDLHVDADLTSDAGRLVVDATADMTAPAQGYRVDADAEGLDLSAFTTSVPIPSVLSGRATIEGSGLALDSLVGSAAVALRSARVGDLSLDSANATLRVQDGVLSADSLRASVAGVLVRGAGSVGMIEGREGDAHLTFSAETLLGLRPVFMGDSILVGDTLNLLEQDALRARGVDPDTLPTAEDVRMAGALEGTADVRGRFGDFDVDLLFDLSKAAYGHNSVDSAHVSLMAAGLPETLGEWDVNATGRGLMWANRQFDQVGFEGAMLQRRGEGTLDVVRRPGETYFMTGAFALDSLGGELQLETADIEVSGLSWILSRPTTVAWTATSVTVDSLEMRRMDEDPMLLTAAGTLTRGGDSDFRLLMEGFHVEQALSLAQREDIDLSGHVDLDLGVVGPAEAPVIDARFDVQDPRYGPVQLTRLEGSLEYRDQLADFRLNAWDQERSLLVAEGSVPVNLALAEVQSRSVDGPMDVSVRADSVDASLVFVYLSALEDVVGTVSADMHIGGTTSQPEPTGTVTLANAGWTIDALGVRHSGVYGDLLLQPDGTVAVNLTSVGSNAASGRSTITGLVRLQPEPTNPTFDLTITFDRFLAVDRRDMQSTISTESEPLRLTGTYRLPVVRGGVRVDEATLFVEEFARNAEVVDLRSPLLYAGGSVVDTTVFVSQPLLAGLSNPFLDNLRVDVDLSVPRNLWLRSRDMNVELGGDLIVRYDRRQSDLVLVGELEALRGSYVVLGRTFEVEEGTASFLGQPGINPTLNIQALSRVRRREGERLEVQATVQGTLVDPVVSLSTDETGISQSDLISYLWTGQPAGEVGRGGTSDLVGGGFEVLTGALVNQLGTALAQDLPVVNRLDYLSFSQSAAIGGGPSGSLSGNVFSGAQVELGKYLTDDVFVIFVLGGESGTDSGDGGTGVKLRGIRMELALAEELFLEAFMEDRFANTRSGFGATGLDGQEVVGMLLFGEWGYGGRPRSSGDGSQ